MREARIICPMFGHTSWDHERKLFDDVHSELEGKLLYNWGGFTKTFGIGGGTDLDGEVTLESVCVYDVAMSADPHIWNVGVLRDIADWLLEAADQHTVYIRYPDGTVELYRGLRS